MVWDEEAIERYFEANPEARDEERRLRGSVLREVRDLSSSEPDLMDLVFDQGDSDNSLEDEDLS